MHVNGLRVEVDVSKVEPHRLVAAQARGVDEFDERPVPKLERLAAVEARKRSLDLVQLGRLGQAARAARSQCDLGDALRTEREAEQRADRGEPPPDRRRRKPTRPATAELGGVVGEDGRVHVVEGGVPPLEPRCERLQVESVGASRCVS